MTVRTCPKCNGDRVIETHRMGQIIQHVCLSCDHTFHTRGHQ